MEQVAGGVEARVPVERAQLGVRMEKRMVKVLKGMAEYLDVTLGELLEDIVLHTFEGGGANAFMPSALEKVKEFKKIYGMDYDVHTNYRWIERGEPVPTPLQAGSESDAP
jgi:hypothetical protein